MAEVHLELRPFSLMPCESLWHVAAPPILKINNGTPVFSIYPLLKKKTSNESINEKETRTENPFGEKKADSHRDSVRNINIERNI